MRNESEIISRKYEINKDIGKAVVVVSLSPSVGREPVVTIRTNDVRKWLEEQEGLKLGEAIQGGSFNNNMSRRLGNNKTVADLQMTYVFKIVQEEKPVVEAKEVKQAKPAPKKQPDAPEALRQSLQNPQLQPQSQKPKDYNSQV